MYSTLGGIHVQSIQRDCVVLEIPSDAQPGLGEPGTPLILTIKFKLEGGRQAVFAGAKVVGRKSLSLWAICILYHIISLIMRAF